MSESDALTPLEADLLAHYHQLHGQVGFPAPGQFRVISRNNTGAGRFTYLEHHGSIAMPDGDQGLGTFSQFEMDGLPNGANFWIEIDGGHAKCLEIVLNGEAYWDGSEGPWRVRDSETGDVWSDDH